MAYPASTLITRSWYLSGIVARNLQGVTGDQLNDGLILLNALLDFKQIETDLIPYWTYNQLLVTNPQQEVYFIQNCAEIQSLTFNYSDVRYSMQKLGAYEYFGSPRVNNIFTLPFNYHFDRQKGGGNLYLYFIPDNNYPLNLYGKFFLTDVSLNTDLTTIYDTSYIEYLRYGLANYMASEYGILFNPESASILKKMERKLMYVMPPDLIMRKSSILTSDHAGALNWGQVNIGRGWFPS